MTALLGQHWERGGKRSATALLAAARGCWMRKVYAMFKSGVAPRMPSHFKLAAGQRRIP